MKNLHITISQAIATHKNAKKIEKWEGGKNIISIYNFPVEEFNERQFEMETYSDKKKERLKLEIISEKKNSEDLYVYTYLCKKRKANNKDVIRRNKFRFILFKIEKKKYEKCKI